MHKSTKKNLARDNISGNNRDRCVLIKFGPRSKFKLNLPFCKSSAGQKCLSYMGPKIWNSQSSDLKSTNRINSFKHKIKDNFFQNIQREEKGIYVLF